MASKRVDFVAQVPSESSDRVYEVKRFVKGRDHWYWCSCPAFKFQRKPIFERRCKHVKVLRKLRQEEMRR